MKKLIALFVLLGSTQASASFCGGYTYQRTLTINSSQVSTGTLNYTNFPVLFSANDVTLSTTTASGGHLSTGYDMIISSDANCNFLVNWDTETVQNVGVSTANVWARLDFSSSTNRTYYLTYGNAAITTYQGISTGTWDSNYVAVHHLNGGASLSGLDSTVNANNFTSITATPSTGTIDGAGSFNGTTGKALQLTPGASLGFTGPQTLECWFNEKDTADYRGLVLNGGSTNRSGAMYLAIGAQNQIYYNTVGAQTLSTGWSLNTWNHLVLTDDGTNLKIYLNGTLGYSGANGTGASGGSLQYALGYNSFDSPNVFSMNGYLDEARISKAVRTADWVKTEYNDQSSPSSFLTLGPESSGSTPANTNQIGLVINGGKLVINGVQLIIK